MRNFLQHVNTTHNPRGFMKLARQEPIFVEFADACLKVLHPAESAKEEVTDEQIVSYVKDKIEEAA
jgi:hypothetical protein